MSWRMLRCGIGGLGLLLAGMGAVRAEGGTWTKKADMPTARNSFATAVMDGKIYTFGGRVNPNEGLAIRVYTYDPAIDAWLDRIAAHPKYIGME
ncbi:MAG: hypothetical protein HW386_1575 [Gammaproteobacteria bacterium]|nr:hypothetical protein [Gammaproteobacteria bacterium]